MKALALIFLTSSALRSCVLYYSLIPPGHFGLLREAAARNEVCENSRAARCLVSRSSVTVKKVLVDKGHSRCSQGRHDDNANRDANASRDELAHVVFHAVILGHLNRVRHECPAKVEQLALFSRARLSIWDLKPIEMH
jgi:hypothetical protein